MRFMPRPSAAALLFILSIAAPLAEAQTNPNSATVDVIVRATVQGLCRIQTGNNPSIQLNIDPSATGRQTASTDIGFKCTRGTNFQLFINNGAANSTVTGLTLKPAGGSAQDNLGYSLSSSVDKTSGQGFGNNSDVKLTLSAAVDDYADARVGDYQDTVTVEIRP